MGITKLKVTNFWQQAGAIAIEKYANQAEVQITKNELILNIPKKIIFERAKVKDMLTINQKPWASHIRPFLKQYRIEQLEKFFTDAEPGKNVCSYCGRQVKKLEVDSLVSNPFSVKANNFTNFYGFGSGFKSICEDCQFLGIMAPLALFFTTSITGRDRRISYVFPEGKDLEETLLIHNWMSRVGQKSALSNVKLSTKYYPSSPYETLLLTLYELYKDSGKLFEANYHVIQIHDQGNTSTVLVNDAFNSAQRLQLLFSEMEALGGDLSNFFNAFVINENGNISTELREKLSKNILKFHQPEEFLEMVVFKLGRPIKYLYEFIKAYTKAGGVKVKEEILEICKKTGEQIGNVVFEAENFGDLYTLRNSKNVESFLETLSMMSVKYAKEKWTLKLPEEFLRVINNPAEWKKAKSLTVIFAVNKYLQRQYARTMNNGGEA